MEHFCDGIHGKSMAIKADGERFFSARSASVSRVAGRLIVAFFALIALFFVEVSILDEVCVC